ncbi:MAG: DUF3015 family protein [Bdellovibrionaceae bacterium]|nr:DUF3015 family protein [Pseudobdellovibrionaceae bacterium]
MLKKLFIIGLLGLAASGANAASYGMAGCGLGAMVFEDQPGKVQIVAGILNNLISPQTSAITSGTSNCNEEGGSRTAELYIETNKFALKEDVARGQGETLAGLMTIWNCNDAAQVGSVLKNNYEHIFATSSSSTEIKSTMQKTIKENQNTAASCQALI